MKFKVFFAISIALFVVVSLLSCGNNKSDTLDEKIAESLARSAAQLDLQSTITFHSLHSDLDVDPKIGHYLKSEFISVQNRVDSTVLALETIITHGDYSSLESDSTLAVESYMIQKYDSILVFMRLPAKLLQKEINARSSDFKRLINSNHPKDLTNNTQQNLLSIRSHINNLRVSENMMFERVAELVPRRLQPAFRYYPIVMSERKTVKKGEPFEAEILIGNFITEDINKYNLKINDIEYKLVDNKIVYKKENNQKLGENKLKMELNIMSPYSLGKFTTEKEFTYNVVE